MAEPSHAADADEPTGRGRPISPRALAQRLTSLQSAGVTALARKAAAERVAPPAADSQPAVERPRSDAARPAPADRPPVVSSPTTKPAANLLGEPIDPNDAAVGADDAPTLEVLQQRVAGCTACGELAATRTQTVFGVGNPNARLCFLGEAPGADEDRLGEPFVGRAGELLNRMLSACTLSRDEVYILNVLKCRPPGNRNPAPAESAACRPFLLRQLELIDPEYVCCLGAVAAQNFLDVTTPIGRLRGRVHRHTGRKVVCTYHPAYLLRNPSAKRPAWDDLRLLMGEMGVEL
ncbi:MAG: uracil-DNA glycosylase family protein [Planctomycetota bacterium]